MAVASSAIFWDYENCSPPSNMPGHELVSRIRDLAHKYGGVNLFKAYTQFSEQTSPRSVTLRSELQSSGVSLTDCPHNGRKNVADQMIIADIFNYLLDHPNPSATTIVLISGDKDFAYTLSILRLRMYRVVVVAPTLSGVHASLKVQASFFFDWTSIMDGQWKDTKNISSYRSTEPHGPFRSKSYKMPDMESPEYHDQVNRSHSYTNSNIDSNFSKNAQSGVFSSRDNYHGSSQRFSSFTEAPPERSIAFSERYQHPDATLSNEDNPALLEPSSQAIADMDSQQTAFSDSENTLPMLAPVTPSLVSTSLLPTGSKETQGQNEMRNPSSSRSAPLIPPDFQRLVMLLENYRLGGEPRPYRSVIALELVTQDQHVYRKAGFPKFGPYVMRAEELGLVKLGGVKGSAWISLHYNLHGKVF